MTSFAWQTASVAALVNQLQGRLSPRKARLIACAYVRQMPMATRGSGGQAIDVAERFADAKATAHELAAARFGGRFLQGHPAWAVCWAPEEDSLAMMERALAWAVGYVGQRGYRPYHVTPDQPLPDLLLEIAATSFLPVSIDPAWLVWSDATVRKMARGIYEGRAFAQMPILGDALEEAGCVDARILEHCRGKNEHARGCWLLDALLSLE